ESPGERKPTDINSLLEEYTGLAYHGMRAADSELVAHIVKNFDKSLGEVDIITQDFARVCLNLLNNAFYAVHQKAKATNEEGYEPTVTVTTRRTGGKAVVMVADNGIGIPDEVVDKIFVPFFTTKPTGSGTGLGLSLSYDIIVQGHGGTLGVEKTPGGGATFVITVPL
ncbi:MAG TPA: ATP-binding protein, partial [Rhodothermales bacterium]